MGGERSEKILSGTLGLVVGDALGVPYEFTARDSFNATGMIGNGTHNQPEGTWSDDSSLTLATLDAIATTGTIEPQYIMMRFVRWIMHGDYAVDHKIFDVGITTASSIRKYIEGSQAEDCGQTGERNNGNGALMRILPLAFVESSRDDIRAVCNLTHNTDICRKACEIYVCLAKAIFRGVAKDVETVKQYLANEPRCVDEFSRLRNIWEFDRNKIKSGGYVIHTLEAAVWCLTTTSSYKEAVLKAVNLGGDTDTTAEVTGGLAGLMYGVGGDKGIPMDWIKSIRDLDTILGILEAF